MQFYINKMAGYISNSYFRPILSFKKCVLISLLIIGPIYQSFSQSIKEDRIVIPMISADMGFNLPGGDFADRFGPSGMVGTSFMLKFKSNFLLGLDGNYLFGQTVKDPHYHTYLENEDGWLTNVYGEPGLVGEKLDGFTAMLEVGYIADFWAPNPNSGFIFTAGAGLMQHKIWIEERGNNLPQLTPEYIKGYDRLCNGFMTNQFIGYIFFHEKAIRNFYAGFEFTQGFTQNRRNWDIIEKKKIDKKRLDLLYSIKVGWVISFHKRMSTEIYYY